MADIGIESFGRTGAALDTLDQVADNRRQIGFVDKKGNIAGGTIQVANRSGNTDQSAVLDKVLNFLQRDIGDAIRSSGGSQQDAARLHAYVLKTANEDFIDAREGPLEVNRGKKIGSRGDGTLDKLQHVLHTAVKAVRGFANLAKVSNAVELRQEAPTLKQSDDAKANQRLARQIEDLSEEITEKRSEVDRILGTPESERNRYDKILLSNWEADLPNLEAKLATLEAKYAKATRQVTIPKAEQPEYRHTQKLEGNHYSYTVSSFEDQSVAASKINVGQWGDLENDRTLYENNPDFETSDPIKTDDYENDELEATEKQLLRREIEILTDEINDELSAKGSELNRLLAIPKNERNQDAVALITKLETEIATLEGKLEVLEDDRDPTFTTLQNFDDDWEIAFADDPSYEVVIKNPGKKDEYTVAKFTEEVTGTKRSVVDTWRGVAEPFRQELKTKIQDTAPPEVAAALITDLEVVWAREVRR